MSKGILDDLQFHLKIKKGDVGRYVIIPGDPGRTDKIAARLEDPVLVAYNREYKTWTGTLDGVVVSTTSSGIGGPSCAIAIEELYKAGADTFVRVGTCGGMALDVIPGDLVIPNGSIRKEGTTVEYTPIEFPAVPNYDVMQALIESADERGLRRHIGVVECKDSFYSQHQPETKPVADMLLYKWNAWLKSGCLASEMESSCLFIVSAYLGCRSGTVLAAINNQERLKAGLENIPTEDTDLATTVAIDAIRKLIKKDREAQRM